jgi:hypothetical protein
MKAESDVRILPKSVPNVTQIRVEYDDGSCDTIRLLSRPPEHLYSLNRKRPESVTPLGAFTAGAIAAVLYGTAFSGKWVEYSSSASPVRERVVALYRAWIGDPPSTKRTKSE